MNNYDDIKRFKEKLNLEGIDYKEIAENNPHSSTANNWAIMQQVASADEPFHPLEHGHTTQPTPTPISNKEFILSALDIPPSAPHSRQQQVGNDAFSSAALHAADLPPAQPQTFASPLMSALSQALPVARAPVDQAQTSSPAGGMASSSDNVGQSHASTYQQESLVSANPFSSPPLNAGQSVFGQTDPGAAFERQIAANQREQEQARFVAPTPADRAQSGIFAQIPTHQDQPGTFAHIPTHQDQPGIFAQIPTRQEQTGLFAQPPTRQEQTGFFAQSPTRTPLPSSEPARRQEMRFNQLFNRKSQQNNGVLPGRDILLSLLLENIALCR
jgi:hypothetical protein